MSSPVVDSHHHFWQPQRLDYYWIDPADPILARAFQPEHLRPNLAAAGVEATVLVQGTQTLAESDYLLGLADGTAFVAGVVTWAEMESPWFEAQLAHFRHHPKFVGIRPQIHDMEDEAWMLRPAVRRAFAVLEREQICFDFLVRPQHLAHVLKVLEAYPQLRAVIDHIAKPRIASRQLEPWAGLMTEIASHPNVHCKVSGMVTEADHKAWQPAHLRPYIDHVVDSFGSERLLFGSDWPVCLQAASYAQVIAAARENLRDLDAAAQAAIFGGNAARFYRLGLPVTDAPPRGR